MKLPLKKLLVPIDFSPISLNAVDYAAVIAHAAGSEITLVHVYDMPEIPKNTNFDLKAIIEKGISDKIEDLKKKNKNLDGLSVTSKVVSGSIHEEIESVARSVKADLIVMGTHGSSGIRKIGKFLLGSNAYRVVNNAPCPIITIKEVNKKINFKNIVLPIDNSKETMKKVGLAIEWAKAFNSKIHILALTAFFEELVVQIKDLKEQVEDIEELLKRNNIAYESKMIRHQKISDSVMNYAEKVNADLVMIVTEQENAIAEMIIHSAARNLVTESGIPVLSINIEN